MPAVYAVVVLIRFSPELRHQSALTVWFLSAGDNWVHRGHQRHWYLQGNWRVVPNGILMQIIVFLCVCGCVSRWTVHQYIFLHGVYHRCALHTYQKKYDDVWCRKYVLRSECLCWLFYISQLWMFVSCCVNEQKILLSTTCAKNQILTHQLGMKIFFACDLRCIFGTASFCASCPGPSKLRLTVRNRQL